MTSIVVVAGAMLGTSALVFAPSSGGLTTAHSDGRALFQAYCSSCHNTTSVPGGALGPELSNIGSVADQRRPGMSGAEYLLESIVRPDAFAAPGSQGAMAGGFGLVLSDDQIRSLVWFLSNQGATGDLATVDALQIVRDESEPEDDIDQVRSKDSILRGRDLFYSAADCSRCHSVLQEEDARRLLGPGLFGVGKQSAEQIRSSILAPSNVIHPGFRQVRIDLIDGSTTTGLLLAQTEREVAVVQERADGSGEIISIPASQVRTANDAPAITPTGVSSMPSDYGRRLTGADLDDIIAFLRTLD